MFPEFCLTLALYRIVSKTNFHLYLIENKEVDSVLTVVTESNIIEFNASYL